MPTLRQLKCEIEWGNTGQPFAEYGTTYGDGVVETYIAIPELPQSFAARLRSRGYIAEGLAMLVFMDGDYQCNRNRLNLKHPKPELPPLMTEIDIRVRQREKALGGGSYLGREWRFDKHNIGESTTSLSPRTLTPHEATDNIVSPLVPVDHLPPNVDRQHFNDLGTICVFVLRCRSKDVEQPTSTTSSEVDDAAVRTSEPTSETSNTDSVSSSIASGSEADAQQTETDQAESEPAEAESEGEPETEHECEHEFEPASEPAESEAAETEPDMLLGFMNDGASDNSRFGLDGERPGPAEQRAWSWNTPYPPPPAGHGPSTGYVPGQPPPGQNGPHGSYAYPPALPQNWRSGPGMSQDQSTAHRPQRHVHFNDQIPPQPPGYGASGQQYVGQFPTGSVGQSQEKSHQAPSQQYNGPNANASVGQPQESGYPQHHSGHPTPGQPGQPFSRQDPSTSAGQTQEGGHPQQHHSYHTPGQLYGRPGSDPNVSQSQEGGYSHHHFGHPISGQPYSGQSSNTNAGQSQESGYPQQPSAYPESGQPHNGQTLNTNVAQPQQGEPPQQPGYYGNPPQTQIHHQVPTHGAVHGNHAYPPFAYGGMPPPQGQVQNFSLVPDLSYQPPLLPHAPPVPSYQPIGYGVPEYAGWPLAANYPAYVQPAWPGQPMPGPSYMTTSNLAPPYYPSHSYPYPQSAYPSGSAVTAPHSVSNHPGGGIWGPPPGSQDPAKDENHQLDGQANQNQNNSGGTFGQSNDNNAQEWGNDDPTQTQAADSKWDNNNTGGSQTGNWNNTPNQTEAPAQEWKPSGNETGQTNNADSSWSNDANAGTQDQGSWNNNANTNSQGQDNAQGQDTWNNNANTNTQGQDTWNTNMNTNSQGQDKSQGQDTWNANANGNTQTQESWNAAPATAQPNDAAITFSQQGFKVASPAQGRLLYGPHGPYYDQTHSPFDDEDVMLKPVVGEEPPYDVPADMPTTHQVKPGAGYMYSHKRRSPEYLDTLEEPFARFVFKYRTRSKLISSIESL